jgi:hypothetical protein
VAEREERVTSASRDGGDSHSARQAHVRVDDDRIAELQDMFGLKGRRWKQVAKRLFWRCVATDISNIMCRILNMRSKRTVSVRKYTATEKVWMQINRLHMLSSHFQIFIFGSGGLFWRVRVI